MEIFNTYGEFSNDKLLQDYGFILAPWIFELNCIGNDGKLMRRWKIKNHFCNFNMNLFVGIMIGN